MFSAKIFHSFEPMIASLGTPRQGYVVERIHVSVTAIRCGTELPSLSLHGKKGQNYLLAKSQSTLRSSIAMTFKILNRP